MSGVRYIPPTAAQQPDDAATASLDGQYIVANNNRWSRIVLNFRNLTPDAWCEFNCHIGWNADEQAQNVHDFAVLGVDFLTEDGSSIDFSNIPGLVRTQIDPHGVYIAGPDYHSRSPDTVRLGRVMCTFLVPSPATHLVLTVRSWRNSHPFRILDPAIRQHERPAPAEGRPSIRLLSSRKAEQDAALGLRHTGKPLTAEPSWVRYTLVQGRRLFVRGQILNPNLDRDGAMARVVFRDAEGESVPLPYPETLIAPAIGAFINIPAHAQTRRFTLELVPPPQAVTVDLGFQSWSPDAALSFAGPLEVSLEDDLLLENISGDELPDAASFLKRFHQRLVQSSPTSNLEFPAEALNRLDRKALASPLRIHERLKAVQQGRPIRQDLDQIRLANFPAWSLPEQPDWTEDPFQAPAWRLEFQSLSWLSGIARDQNPIVFARVLDLALSWSRANPWTQPADVLSVHPIVMAIRAEVLLDLLSLAMRTGREQSRDILQMLLGEVVRHGFALSQIIGQNVFSRTIYQVHAASSLLAIACALPHFPLAGYWSSVALAHLRDEFDELIGAGGGSIEQSQHYRLEILSIAVILDTCLSQVVEAQELRQLLAERLSEAVRVVAALVDPTGMLPPMGDTPQDYHHASWLKRLISEYGTASISQEALATGLLPSQGNGAFSSAHARAIATWHYKKEGQWGYLCAAFSEQRHVHGHFDCGTFVFSSNGTRWITDSHGSSFHETGSTRQYLISSRAHNVAIPDGREQTAGLGWLRSTRSLEGAHLFEIGTNTYGPDYAHRRIYVCMDDLSAIAVFDCFSTLRNPISFEGLLHLDPHVTAAVVNPKLILGFHNNSRLRIIPRLISGRFGGVEIANGRSDHPSSIQGFVSRRAGLLEPANVVRYFFSGHKEVCGGIIAAVNEMGLQAISTILETPAVQDDLKNPSQSQP